MAELSRDNWEVLNSLERIAAKLLKLVEGGPTATAPRRVYSPERSSVIRSVVKLGAAMDGERAGVSAAGDQPISRPCLAHISPISRLYLAGERAGVSAAGDKRALLLTNHQQALLRAVIHALHSKGIECHERMWQVAAKRIGVNPLRLALERAREAEHGAELPLSEPVTPPPPEVTKPRSKRPSREEAKPRSPPAPPTPLTGGDHYGTPPSPLTPAGPRVAGGAGGDNHGTGGAALAAQLRRAYGEAEAALEEWQLEEFTSSVQTYKECGEEAIQLNPSPKPSPNPSPDPSPNLTLTLTPNA